MDKETYNQYIRAAIVTAIEESCYYGHRIALQEVLDRFNTETEKCRPPANAAEIRKQAELVAEDTNDIYVAPDADVDDNGDNGYWVDCSVFVRYPEES